MKKKQRKERGITLIALIITVIIMLILAGIAISVLTSDGGLFGKARNAVGVYERASQNEADKIASIINELDNYLGSVGEYKKEFGVNSPKITEGMIPVKYDGTNWVKADVENVNNDWYNYGAAVGNAIENQWANIVTVKENGTKTRTEYLNANIGTAIEMDDILTFLVWIPRYAYSITQGYKQVMDGTTGETTGKIDIKFLVGSTNMDENNNIYEKDYDASKLNAGDTTPMIVHPAFTFGTQELEGIWVAKFEASGVNDLSKTDPSISGNWENYVGNASANSSETTPVTENTVLMVKPNVPSWRNITTGDMQYQSMKMSNSSVYGMELKDIDSHLIKNIEWGAVTYLCYSKYGCVPQANGCYNYKKGSSAYKYDHITGAGPNIENNIIRYDYLENDFVENNAYNTSNGMLASTTGNIYGIYDFSGGSWERTAAYLNNSNENLELYGNPTQDTNIKYFESGNLKEEYLKYFDKYEVSIEELNNKIIVEDEELTQEELWNKEGSLKYNSARLRLSTELVKKSNTVKGDGLHEMIYGFTYYGKYSTKDVMAYFITAESPGIVTSGEIFHNWDYNIAQMSTLYRCFGVRSGMTFDTLCTAGVSTSGFFTGETSTDDSFRPVIVI